MYICNQRIIVKYFTESLEFVVAGVGCTVSDMAYGT